MRLPHKLVTNHTELLTSKLAIFFRGMRGGLVLMLASLSWQVQEGEEWWNIGEMGQKGMLLQAGETWGIEGVIGEVRSRRHENMAKG